EPAKRWPDAKSLRAALSPMDDESDDGMPGRILRVGTAMLLLALFALTYQFVFTWLVPGLRVPDRFKGMLFGIFAPSVALLLGAGFQFMRQGLDARTIVFKALQQPRWWRPWYPKRFRRRGDI